MSNRAPRLSLSRWLARRHMAVSQARLDKQIAFDTAERERLDAIRGDENPDRSAAWAAGIDWWHHERKLDDLHKAAKRIADITTLWESGIITNAEYHRAAENLVRPVRNSRCPSVGYIDHIDDLTYRGLFDSEYLTKAIANGTEWAWILYFATETHEPQERLVTHLSQSARVRLAVLGNPHWGGSFVQDYLEDEDDEVRRAALAHPSMTGEQYAALAMHDDFEVREAVWSADVLPPQFQQILNEEFGATGRMAA